MQTAVKYDLGVRTRKAYLSQDTQALNGLLADYALLIQRIDRFYEVYRIQWMQENKPHGFELQDYRLGGLARRVKNCMQQLQAYLDGSLDRIEELEEPVLDIKGEQNVCGEAIEYNSWATTITANVI